VMVGMEPNTEALLAEIKDLQQQVAIANETLDAIRTGQIDALVVKGHNGHVLYTLKSADLSYRIFIERMNEGAVTLSSTGVILYCNSKFASMIHKPLSRVLGSMFIDFIAEHCKEEFRQVFEKAWTDEDIKNETILFSLEGNMSVKLSLTPLALEEGISLSIILTDLTHQKKTEQVLKAKNEELEILNEALAKSNTDLQQFASVASHDLQEPLRKIQIFANFIKEKNSAELSKITLQYVDKILASASRMKVLIVDILNYSRLSSDEMRLEPIDLREVFEEILDDFEIRIAETRAKVIIGKLPVVEVNKGQIRQVFQNLLSNALKFSHKDVTPKIIIEEKDDVAVALGLPLKNQNDFCRISVQDNGIGFDQKYASSIFSLFEKLNPKSSYEGSGIGLAIAKKIINKHHGFIVAKSIEGKGSEFNIILPKKRLNHVD
jgi:PAS domain S-box-containing protein